MQIYQIRPEQKLVLCLILGQEFKIKSQIVSVFQILPADLMWAFPTF